MYQLQHNPRILKASLRTWKIVEINGAPESATASTRCLSYMIYTYRGLRLREFIELAGDRGSADALYNTTGVKVGESASAKYRATLKTASAGKGAEGERKTPEYCRMSALVLWM